MMNVKALIKHSRALELEINQLNKVLSENKAKIQQFFDKKQIKTIEVEAYEKDDVALIANKVERVYIDYDIEKLKNNLSKEVFNEVANKSHTINSIDKMIKLLKEYKVPSEKFKALVDTSININKEAIKALYEVGEITKNDLQGCYTAKVVKSIQIKEKKGDTH